MYVYETQTSSSSIVYLYSMLEDLAAGVFTCLYALQLLETVGAFGR